MLQLKDIRKSYTTAGFTQMALDGVNLSFRDNEFAAVLGPSGSGKTTMLNIIGGLDRYDSGDLEIDGISTKEYKDSDWDTYRNNRIGFVFQSYNLIPHQTILANVELALTLSGVSKEERRERAEHALDRVGLIDHIRKRPNQLSGGQMQRVAIARALINDPEILLADEPTGALDTKTSEQVMELLTEIAKEKLVIMVTHNNELAQEYANRIVSLKDGQVVQDTRPFNPQEEAKSEKEIRKASMSFLTAISLSFSNLMTKKGRTFVTALAGSIGIIGIAAILALASGINDYIENVEQETMSIYPLTIQTSGMDLSSMISVSGPSNSSSEDGVYEMAVVESMFSSRRKNDLASLKEYLQSNPNIDSHVHTIQYSYDITPQVYLPDTTDRIAQVNPDSILGNYGIGNSGMSSIMGALGGGSGMQIFSEMPNSRDMYEYQYDMLEGRWPQNYDELVLVLSVGGGITDYELYSMGLRDRDELRKIIEAFINNSELELDIEPYTDITPEELMSVEFKLVNPADRYQYDSRYEVWVDKSKDEDFMKPLVDNGITLKVVGVVQPKDGITATTLSNGLNYTSDLASYLIDEASNKEIVKQQLANPTKNVITGKSFVEENEDSGTAFNFSDMITIDENAIAGAFQMDASGIQLDMSGLAALPAVAMQVPLPVFDLNMALGMIAPQVNIPTDELVAIAKEVVVEYLATQTIDGSKTPQEIMDDFDDYLATPSVQAGIAIKINNQIDVATLETEVTTAIQNYMNIVMRMYMGDLLAAIGTHVQNTIMVAMESLPQQIQESFKIDQSAFSRAFKVNTNEEDMLGLMQSLMSTEESTLERNLGVLGYADVSNPSRISIYPLNFDSKNEVIDILDVYNDKMEASGYSDRVVSYTDLVGVLMKSVTDIIDMISYALVAFVSISLIVSSIMIGVITYISVLERKKEIGILRALGASKKNIRQVFNAETLIVGFVAGVLGIGVTLVISTIANAIVHANFGIRNISQLPLNAALVLIVVSMFLTFIAGLFPSSAAARRDPVEALRSE